MGIIVNEEINQMIIKYQSISSRIIPLLLQFDEEAAIIQTYAPVKRSKKNKNNKNYKKKYS